MVKKYPGYPVSGPLAHGAPAAWLVLGAAIHLSSSSARGNDIFLVFGLYLHHRTGTCPRRRRKCFVPGHSSELSPGWE
jgi:hypothetical protein